MKTKLLNALSAIVLLLMPNVIFAQPNLGTASKYVFFTSIGAVGNTGISQITGDVGSNNGSSTGFGNVNGNMTNNSGTTATCAADVLAAYNQLNGTTATIFLAPALGSGQVLNPGVHSIPSAATLSQTLTLDAKGNANGVFIIKIQAPFSTSTNSKVKLINGAQACNVFWKVEGLVSMAAGTTMRGTIIANNSAIQMSAGDTLEGRALSTSGAITVNGVMAFTPVGCGSALLTGPVGPALNSTACYAVFSTNGAVTNSGVSYLTGDVGTNVGLTTGFQAINVTGAVHPIADASTAACAADLGTVYTYLNTLTADIELLYPAQFGRNLVLTPHTYIMKAATVLTDTVYLNGRGNANAVFVIQINGALSTSTYSKVILTNGTQSKNVYWKVDGAVSINDYSIFRGTVICNNGAINFKTGVTLDGRALTTKGTFTTAAINVVATAIPSNCGTTGVNSLEADENESVSIYPNPFNTSITITMNDLSQLNKTEVRIFDILGSQVASKAIAERSTTLETGNLPSGTYIYQVISNNVTIQAGRLISAK